MNKHSFFIALYNLHLPNEIPPSNEVKQRLTKTVWKYYRIIPPSVISIREQSVTPNYNDNHKPIAYHRFPVDEGGNKIGRGITIAKNYLGDELSNDELIKLLEVDFYESLNNNWWKTDYPSFLEEYTRLRSFIDDYLDGKFKIENCEWVNEVSKIFEYKLTIASEIAKKVVIETPLMIPDTPKHHEEIDINRVNIRLFPRFSYTNANAAILEPAYYEIIDLIRIKSSLKRCECRRCDNIFDLPQKKGMPRRFCSDKCRNYENTRRRRDKGRV
jgi:hypothetical protein